MRRFATACLCLLLWFSLAIAVGCGPAAAPKSITLATTTSTQDSGLLDDLLPRFREQTGIEVKVVAVGSGQALELGRRGDADVLLTHAPPAEEKFVAEGWGQDRRGVMYNDFVLVGPGSDPAAIQEERSIAAAFARIAVQQAPFVSRGDDSGTHQKELAIWQEVGQQPDGEWYVLAGAGMAQALRMAREKNAYTLSDRGTYLALRQEIQLTILSQNDPLLKNPYSVMMVNPERHPHVNAIAAKQFADFLTSPATKQAIAEFGVKEFGQPLFFAE